MSKIIGLLVTHNEAGRYLDSVLRHNRPLLDDLLIFDDRSTDATTAIAGRYGDVVIRSEDVPSFVEHEGRFRAQAWAHLKEVFQPEEGDVIVSFDADEYLVGDPTNFEGYAARVPIDECWQIRDGIPMIRIDKSWGRIYGVRCWRWHPCSLEESFSELANRRTASGSGPNQRTSLWHHDLRIMHVGYLDPEDRENKYERYRRDARHGSAHVQSIKTRPSLRRLHVGVDVWRGT